MILLFDIGNTHTHIGLANGRRVLKNTDIPTAKWFGGGAAALVRKFTGAARIEGAILCSVVPRARRSFAKRCARSGRSTCWNSPRKRSVAWASIIQARFDWSGPAGERRGRAPALRRTGGRGGFRHGGDVRRGDSKGDYVGGIIALGWRR